MSAKVFLKHPHLINYTCLVSHVFMFFCNIYEIYFKLLLLFSIISILLVFSYSIIIQDTKIKLEA